MSKFNGLLFLLKVGDGGAPETFTTAAAQRVTGGTIGNEQIDITSKDGSRWKLLLEGGVRNMSMTCSGLITDEASYKRLQELARTGVFANFQLWFKNGAYFEGPLLVTSLEGTGEYTDAQQYSLTLESANDITLHDGEEPSDTATASETASETSTATATGDGPLDPFTDGLFSAWGVSRLLSDYNAPLLRVRRSSDDAELDVSALVDGSLDETALLAFVGSNSAFVVTAYDQSNQGNDWTQVATGKQPRIVNAGVYDGKLVFNTSGVDDRLACINSDNTGGTYRAIARRVNVRARNADNIEFEYGNSANMFTSSLGGEFRLDDQTGDSKTHLQLAGFSNGAFEKKFTPSDENGQANTYVVSLAHGGTVVNSSYLFINGAERTSNDGLNWNGAGFPATFPAMIWAVGAMAAGAGAQIDMWNCAVYSTDKRTDAVAINAALEAA